MNRIIGLFGITLLSTLIIGCSDSNDSTANDAVVIKDEKSVVVGSEVANASNWNQWGHDLTKNMASLETGISHDFYPGEMDFETEIVDKETTKNIKWIAKLGSQSYGNVTVANGNVIVGTNNDTPRDPKHKGDRGVLMCFDAETAKLKWQMVCLKLGAGKVSDWEYLGICSSPYIDDKYVYIVTNKCEVMCIDLAGLANGNDGFQDEGQYAAGVGKPPLELGPLDADIVWIYDMRKELGVFPHNITSSSVLVVGDKLFATTSNGQDWSHVNIPAPRAPALICLDKNTGELLGEEASGISARILHCNWSSPGFANVDGTDTLIFGAGDGFCYGFDPNPVKDADGYGLFTELWRVNCNPPEYIYKNGKDGAKIKYPRSNGASELIATPVYYKNKIYALVGQDPEHGEGVGCLTCIDPTKRGDSTLSGGIVWQYKGIERSISTLAIVDDLIFAADYTGRLHCIDAITGEKYWMHDTMSSIWSSPMTVDGKVYLGTEDGTMVIVKAAKTLEVVNEIDMGAAIYSSAVVSNGVLYVGTMSHLYAVQGQ